MPRWIPVATRSKEGTKRTLTEIPCRVKDIEKSLKFYQEVLGMTLQRVSEQKEAGFSLYFLSYGPQAPKSSPNGVNPVADREGLLELT